MAIVHHILIALGAALGGAALLTFIVGLVKIEPDKTKGGGGHWRT